MTTMNVHKVPAKQWRRWGDRARRVFNAVYSSMSDQQLFAHPKAEKIRPAFWKTTRWNAAWIAADAAEGA